MAEPRGRANLRIHALAWRLRSESADPQDLEHLEALLRDDPQALAEYVRYASLLSDVELESNPALLAPVTGAALPAPTLSQAETTTSPPVLGFLGSALNVAAGWLSSPKILALTVLGSLATYFAGLIISIAISRAWLTDRNAAQHVELAPPARIITASNCRWEEGAPRDDQRSHSTGGASRLAAGTVEFEFDGGAHVRIEGPAEFMLRTAQRLELTEGWAVAYVPRRARGFTIGTPAADIVDLGTEFGVEVRGDGKTEVHVLRGVVEVNRALSAAGSGAQPIEKVASGTTISGRLRVSAGNAVRVAPGTQAASIDFDGERFAPTGDKLVSGMAAATGSSQPKIRPGRAIWLGNLFDDPHGTPLDAAMQSDTFRAGAGADDLGVERIVYGEQPVKEIAPGVKFDFHQLGWGKGEERLQAANDAWTSQFGGIRLQGQPLAGNAPKIEEGIGLCSSALLTFDLDEIRAAGDLGPQAFDFVCDSAGVNDTGMNPYAELKMKGGGSIHLVVLVASGSQVLTANVDGKPAPLINENGIWSVAKPQSAPLHTFGPYISIRQAIPAEAKYLTLATTGAGDNHWDDHGVWVGARLETAETPAPARGQPTDKR